VDIIVDTPLVRIDTLSKTPTVIVRVPEPLYLRKLKENLTEPVTEIIYRSPQISLHWTIDWSEETYGTYRKGDYHGLIEWLDTYFSPKFVEKSKDLFKWYFKGSFLEEFLGVGDVSIDVVKATAEFVPLRTGWFFATIETETTVTFFPSRPILKFETDWLAEKIIIYNDNRLPYIFRVAGDIILRQENLKFERFHYSFYYRTEKTTISFLFGNKQEDHIEPPKWSFHLEYEPQSVDFEAVVRLFSSVKSDLEQNPSEGIGRLKFIISMIPPTRTILSMIPPTRTILIGDLDLLRMEDELREERGSGLKFVLETLEELRNLLNEVGI